MALGTGVHNLSLVVRAHNRASRALASVNRDLAAVDKVRKTVQTGLSTMGRVGALAIKSFAVAVALALGGSIFAFSKFDAAMTKSLAIAEDVSPQMEKALADAARGVAKETVFSANQAAEAYFSLFSAGQTAEQAMGNLPTVAKFAQAGLFDLSVATELLVTSQNALGLAFEDPIKNAEQMTRVADVLAAADKNAVGTIEEFADALTNRAAAAMRTYGIEVEEGVAVLAAWATQGLKGRTAGEAFAIVVRDLQKAALKEADAWREANAAVFDSKGNLRDMADIVSDLENAMEGLTDAQKKQLLSDLGFQERSQQRLLQLLGTSDAIREFEATFVKAGGTVEEISNKQLQTATKQLGLLKNAIVDIFIGAGQEFDESFTTMVGGIREFVNVHAEDWIDAVGRAFDVTLEWGRHLRAAYFYLRNVDRGLDPTIDKLMEFSEPLALIVGWIEKVIRFWNDLRKPIRDAIGEWATMLPWIFLIAGALKLIGIVLAVVASPAAIIAGIIAGLVVLFRHLWENSAEFRDAMGEIATFFKNEVVPFLEEAWARIQEAAAIFMEWFQSEMLPDLIEIWEQIKDTFVAAWEFIRALWDAVVAALTDIWEMFGEDIINAVKRHWEVISGIVQGAFQIIEGIFQVFTGLLKGDWGKLWEGIKNIFKGLWSVIRSLIASSVNTLVTFFSIAWTGIKETWRDLWEGFKDVVRGPLNWVLDKLEGFVNKAIDTLNGLISTVNKIPGVNIGRLGRISIPRLAVGGDVIRSGLALVGENGPELLKLGQGAQVAPLGSTRHPMAAGAGIQVEQIIFQGTPQSMLQDWRNYTRLALRGL